MILELDTMIRLLGVGGEDTLPDTGEQESWSTYQYVFENRFLINTNFIA
jgi:hypothetical protein